ncbi:MAG: type II toxin-antitoxin system VapC family toxin [Verrucomicrobia bacterium]|nr:type II toxin-antitoxin system VapC family toxin [Verrucomicrobiota bacterium]
MSVYCDSSLLFKLYVFEQDSPQAAALVSRSKPPLPLSPLHEIEIRNAIRQRRLGKTLTSQQVVEALNKFQGDLDAGFFERRVGDWSVIFHQAEAVSRRFAEIIPCRSLDILHIATAIVWGAEEFCTFDLRQWTLARKSGLAVKP